MSSAAIETNPAGSTSSSGTSRRTSSGSSNRGRNRAESRSRDQFDMSFVSTELAVSELVRGSVHAARALLPGFVSRPTEAVEYAFDLAEQGLAATRRLAYEVASVLETGFEALERDAA